MELEEYPRNILLQRQRDGILPPFPIWDDVCTFDGKPWRGLVDIISGGFPCQDISAAGKGAGIAGTRSGLWKEMHRIICEVRPGYAFMENSPMLTSRGLGTVLGDLAEIGYNAAWLVLGASDMGAPHQRKRIWILAVDSDTDLQRIGWGGAFPYQTQKAQFLSDSDKSQCQRIDRVPIKYQQKNTRSGNTSRMGSTGNPWETEPGLGRVADGVAARVDRLKAIGNGQVPLVAATAFRILKQQLSTSNIQLQK